jgi:hypothetical protein
MSGNVLSMNSMSWFESMSPSQSAAHIRPGLEHPRTLLGSACLLPPSDNRALAILLNRQGFPVKLFAVWWLLWVAFLLILAPTRCNLRALNRRLVHRLSLFASCANLILRQALDRQ